jgi:hypothetical protein
MQRNHVLVVERGVAGGGFYSWRMSPSAKQMLNQFFSVNAKGFKLIAIEVDSWVSEGQVKVRSFVYKIFWEKS